jgi:hypothetical protein
LQEWKAGWEGSLFVECRNLCNFLYQSDHSNLFRFVDKDVLGFKNTHKKHDTMMVNLLPLGVMALSSLHYKALET